VYAILPKRFSHFALQQTKDGAEWDGNVPANYRTSDSPPRALGRWINRQRSAYGKDKLKAEYIEKLNKIGLKWSVHERRPVNSSPEPVPSTPTSGDVALTPTVTTSSNGGAESTAANNVSSTSNGGAESTVACNVGSTSNGGSDSAGAIIVGSTSNGGAESAASNAGVPSSATSNGSSEVVEVSNGSSEAVEKKEINDTATAESTPDLPVSGSAATGEDKTQKFLEGAKVNF
jgi:hypothetical protein